MGDSETFRLLLRNHRLNRGLSAKGLAHPVQNRFFPSKKLRKFDVQCPARLVQPALPHNIGADQLHRSARFTLFPSLSVQILQRLPQARFLVQYGGDLMVIFQVPQARNPKKPIVDQFRPLSRTLCRMASAKRIAAATGA